MNNTVIKKKKSYTEAPGLVYDQLMARGYQICPSITDTEYDCIIEDATTNQIYKLIFTTWGGYSGNDPTDVDLRKHQNNTNFDLLYVYDPCRNEDYLIPGNMIKGKSRIVLGHLYQPYKLAPLTAAQNLAYALRRYHEISNFQWVPERHPGINKDDLSDDILVQLHCWILRLLESLNRGY